jgi:hypothetical protein
MPRPGLKHPRKKPSTNCTQGWVRPQGLSARVRNISPPTEIRSPERAARSHPFICTQLMPFLPGNHAVHAITKVWSTSTNDDPRHIRLFSATAWAPSPFMAHGHSSYCEMFRGPRVGKREHVVSFTAVFLTQGSTEHLLGFAED